MGQQALEDPPPFESLRLGSDGLWTGALLSHWRSGPELAEDDTQDLLVEPCLILHDRSPGQRNHESERRGVHVLFADRLRGVVDGGSMSDGRKGEESPCRGQRGARRCSPWLVARGQRVQARRRPGPLTLPSRRRGGVVVGRPIPSWRCAEARTSVRCCAHLFDTARRRHVGWAEEKREESLSETSGEGL